MLCCDDVGFDEHPRIEYQKKKEASDAMEFHNTEEKKIGENTFGFLVSINFHSQVLRSAFKKMRIYVHQKYVRHCSRRHFWRNVRADAFSGGVGAQTAEGRRHTYRAIVQARPPHLNNIYLATQTRRAAQENSCNALGSCGSDRVRVQTRTRAPRVRSPTRGLLPRLSLLSPVYRLSALGSVQRRRRRWCRQRRRQ
ncbi:BEACH domain-containing protein C2, partial [Nymphaea thermarum]